MTGKQSDGPFVGYGTDGVRATLTLDSPHNRNAISPRLIADFTAGLARAQEDPQVRAIVLTHSGGTFCAGADLSAAAGGDTGGGDTGSGEGAAPSPTAAMAGLLRSILECPKPVIGLIDGHVRAGGMGLVGACDIVVAGPRCTFALTEARLGLAASIVSLTVLPRMSSRAAGRYFLTGETFDRERAEAMGLVTVAADDAAAATDRLVAELRKASPQGLAESKALLTRGLLAGFDSDAARLCERSARLFGTPEAIEGMTAFLQKRAPSWAE
ncbi:enoyl-CoA hydratase family protein [Tomitella fengzijianii]|uniref:Enoyl-CoA hydratase family protein n=1 Tax=Tomitella fengzijianii TaxID=2597660 RepID=A0A516X0H2_9ACTN|nr:enoyl-CoA hydratase family protein [Tomitella fengzijianii]QDQ96579.1 enoyl-CoA hydratase family protein [Tomitella fengzijianii]